jgi:DNA-binding LacI/PurR family transcriptional regulator
MIDREKVAKLAGVSPETVSRAFRGYKYIAPATREKVLRIGRRWGYVPHSAARAMRRGRFERIACVVNQYGPKGISHNPYTGYLDPATSILAERGYSVVFEPFYMDPVTDDFIEAPRLFSELAVDGVLGINATDPVLAYVDHRMNKVKAPVVWVNRNPQPGIRTVVCDEKAGARRLARYLIDLGHRRIGYFGNRYSHYSTVDRYEGVRDELEAADLDTADVDWSVSGKEVEFLERLFDRRPRVTGLVCYNLPFYHMAVQVAGARGLKVPRDLSLCYFASIWELPVFFKYPATILTVCEPEIAKTAVGILLDMIGGNSPPEGARYIPGKFCPGLTTACPGQEMEKGKWKEYMENQKALCFGNSLTGDFK